MFDNSMPMNINTGLALETVLGKIGPHNKKREIIFLLQRIAAVLTIPLIIALVVMHYLQYRADRQEENSYVTTTAAFGSISSFELKDGSRVWLNAGSRLEVPIMFGDTRYVKLSGEAYFEVQSDRSSPFVVSVDGFSVEATGTCFNVMAFEGQPPSVTLAEGIVTVHLEQQKDWPGIIELRPGQHLAMAEKGSVDIDEGDVYKYYSWKDGKLIFRNDLLADIMTRISLQYNVDIEIADPSILNNRYRATFDEETLTEVLDLLKLASPFEYREIPATIQPDGSFSKRNIIINSSDTNRK
jgi:ferric-dicitrate binding protein FerR (iron transport regulator)